MHYAEKLVRRFNSLTKLEIKSFCITDRQEQVGSWATPIIPPKPSKGWWNKVNLFSPEMPSGWLLYMDVDIVILKNFDHEIVKTIQAGSAINCVSDAIGWMGEKFNSSLLLMQSGCRTDIYEKFVREHDALIDRAGGDQVWIGPQLEDINYIDMNFPFLKKNLKFDLGKLNGNNLKLPADIPEDIKLIDCSGRPKPHELEAVPYIKRNWHDVEPIVELA